MWEKEKEAVKVKLKSGAATKGVLLKKVFLKISKNSQERTCTRISFLIKLQQAFNFVKKEALAQLFSCEFYEIFKNSVKSMNCRTESLFSKFLRK